MPKFLSKDFFENLKEVSSPRILNKKKFHEQGLFSEQIFGPLKNYTCQCGIYHGTTNAGTTCKICGVDIVQSRERRTRFAKIVLPTPIVNPIFYDLVVTLGGSQIKKPLDMLMRNENSALFIDTKDGHYVAEENEKMWAPEKFPRKMERTEAIYELVRWLANDLKDALKK